MVKIINDIHPAKIFLNDIEVDKKVLNPLDKNLVNLVGNVFSSTEVTDFRKVVDSDLIFKKSKREEKFKSIFRVVNSENRSKYFSLFKSLFLRGI